MGQRANGSAFSLIALGLAALVPTMAHAQTQDLFVANRDSNTISRYAGTGPGTFSTTPTTFATGLNSPQGLAFDAQGNLFAVSGDSITEFASTGVDTFAAGKIFATGGTLDGPFGLAFDAKGDLFAADFGSDAITELVSTGPGTFGATKFLTGGGLAGPRGLAFDAQGDLFAADSADNNITEFASTGAGTFAAGKTFATDSSLNTPTFLAFGPITPPAVPEASTTVSLGLLLALGMGGLVAARKRRKA